MAFTAKGEVSLKLASLFFYILNKGGSLYWRMLMNIKAKEVKTLDNLKLDVLFTNGINKIYDVKKAMSYYEPFKELEDNPYLFKQAKVDCGECAVCWDAEIDVTEWKL